jgi:hypothetical protein
MESGGRSRRKKGTEDRRQITDGTRLRQGFRLCRQTYYGETRRHGKGDRRKNEGGGIVE